MSRFKTELCNNLIELGNCKYGDRCHYAHGAHELRQVSRRHPKYRTEKCKNFDTTGKCPFGPRCSYVHAKPDFDSMIDQLTKYMQFTKAPKPDSEDDMQALQPEQQHHFAHSNSHSSLYGSSSHMALSTSDFNTNGSETDIPSLPITRTNTNTSLSISSTCESMSATTNNDEHNKENQLVVPSSHNYHHHHNSQASANESKRTSSFISNGYTIDNPFAIKRPFCQARDFHSAVSPTKTQEATQLATTTTNSTASFKATNSSAAESLFSFNNIPPFKQHEKTAISSANSIPRTPLGSNTFSNISINNKSNLTNLYAPQTKPSSAFADAFMVQDTSLSKAHGNAYNTSSFAFGSTSYGCNKKSQPISASSSSNSNSTASDPFGISNPFSDYVNNSNLNLRSLPHQPNKQYYTRF